MTNLKEIKFRASGIGKLMIGQQGLTDVQTARLNYLQERKDGAEKGIIEPGKTKTWAKLTDNMQAEMDELIAKRDAPFELSRTAKSFITEKWMWDKFRFKRVVITKELQKGNLCEQDAFQLLDEVIPMSELRHKNPKRYSNDYTTGHPDICLFQDDMGEDTKCSWDLMTFVKTEAPSLDYISQGQAYMDLTGLRKFRVAYCLVDTPNILLQGELRSLFFKFNASPVYGIIDEDGEIVINHYENEVPKDLLEAIKQTKRNHIYSHIPPQNRVKVFEFEYDPAFIEEMKFRVEVAREFYMNLTLEQALQMIEL